MIYIQSPNNIKNKNKSFGTFKNLILEGNGLVAVLRGWGGAGPAPV